MNKRLVTYLASLATLFVGVLLFGLQTNSLGLPSFSSFPSLASLESQVSSQLSTVSSALPSEVPSPSNTMLTTTSTRLYFYGSSTAPIKTNALVVRAVDGDTLVARLDGESRDSTVRFLGINTPETVDPRKPVQCFGKEASKHVHGLIDGQRVLLVPDPRADDVDKYSRLLRNVVLADGTDLGAQLVSDGYAYAYLSFPLDPQRKRELKNLQENAKIAQRGLWSPTTCNGQF